MKILKFSAFWCQPCKALTKTLQGMLAVPDDQRYDDRADKSLTVEQWQSWCVTDLTEHAYRVADAMLQTRRVKE